MLLLWTLWRLPPPPHHSRAKHNFIHQFQPNIYFNCIAIWSCQHYWVFSDLSDIQTSVVEIINILRARHSYELIALPSCPAYDAVPLWHAVTFWGKKNNITIVTFQYNTLKKCLIHHITQQFTSDYKYDISYFLSIYRYISCYGTFCNSSSDSTAAVKHRIKLLMHSFQYIIISEHLCHASSADTDANVVSVLLRNNNQADRNQKSYHKTGKGKAICKPWFQWWSKTVETGM